MSKIKNITFKNGGFTVNGNDIRSENALQAVLTWARHVYAERFADKYREHAKKQVQRQKERNVRRKEREQAYVDALGQRIDRNKFNRFRWTPRVSIPVLKNLYHGDSRGIQDSEVVAHKAGTSLFSSNRVTIVEFFTGT